MSAQISLEDRAAAGLVARVIRADVRERRAYVVQDAQGLIKLDAMENPYGVPEHLRDALGKRLASVAINRYPDAGATALRAAIAHALQLPAEIDVLLGNGSDELINLLAFAVAQPEASILSVGPAFVMYQFAAELMHLPFHEVPLAADFTLDRDAVLAAMARHAPTLVFMAYPNNPTGNLFARADLEAIIAAAPGLVIVDEAYAAFAPDSFVNDLGRWPQLLVLRTFSKVGLAGIRLGYLLGARALIGEIDKVRPPYNVNALTQCAALFMLEHAEVLSAQADALVHARHTLAAALAQRADLEVFVSAANFILFRLLSDDAEASCRVFEDMRSRGVLIKNMAPQHRLLANCLRVTVSTPEENAAFLRALDAAWPRRGAPA